MFLTIEYFALRIICAFTCYAESSVLNYVVEKVKVAFSGGETGQ